MTGEQYVEDGNRMFRDDLYWAALLRYRQATESGVDTPLLHYNIGVANYKAGQHIRARESLLRALESPTLRIAAQYNLGLNAYAAGDERDALRWFRLARDQQQNETLADYARVAISRIRQGQRADDPIVQQAEKQQRERETTRLELNARIGFGNDDNVFRSPSDPYTDFSDPALPVIVTPVVTSGAYMPVQLSAKYRVNAYENEGFFGAYRISGRYYQDKELENANEFRHELSFGSEYRRKTEERERRVYSAFKIAQHDEVYYDTDDGTSRDVDGVNLDDRMNYLRYGPELTFRQSFNRFALGLNLKGQLWNYEETVVVPEYDHEYFKFGLYAQYRFTPTSLLKVAVDKSSRRYGDRRARDVDGTIDINNENLRYDYLAAELTARQRISRGLWFGVEYQRTERTDRFVGYNDYIRDSYGAEINWDIGRRFELEVNAYYHLYDFPIAFAYNNPASGRKTLESVDASLVTTFRMTRSLSLVLKATLREKASNDVRISYDRNQIVLGVRWEP